MLISQPNNDIKSRHQYRMDLSVTTLLRAINAHTPYVITDTNGLVIDANSLFLQLSEYTRADLLGTTGKVLNSSEHEAEFWENVWETLRQERIWKGRLRGRRNSGELYWADTTICVQEAKKTGCESCLCFFTDVSELVQLQQRERSILDQNLEIARTAKIGWWEMSMADQKPRWSQLTREIYEVAPDYEPTLEDAITFCKEGEHRDRFAALVKDTIVSGNQWDEEFCIVTAKKKEIWVRAVGTAQLVEGKCLRVFGTLQDIDIRKRAQLEAHRVSDLMRAVLSTAKDFIIVATDVRGTITVYNTGAEIHLGYTADELVGREQPAVFHDLEQVSERAKELSKMLGRKVEGFETFTTIPEIDGYERREWTYVRKDGTRFPANLVVRPLKDINGGTTGFVGIAINISEKKRAEADLKEREELLEKAKERLALATKAGGVGIWDHNLCDGSMAWDAQMFQLFGVDPSGFESGYDVWQRKLHPDDKERVLHDTRTAIERKQPYNTEYRIVYSAEEVRSLHSLAQVYYDTDGKPTRMVGTNWDVTEQAKQRERLIDLAAAAEQANHAKTNFLANMSHEIRTPLNGIIGMTSLLLDSDSLEASTRNSIEIVHSSSNALLSLINDILDFSKIEAGKTELEEVVFDLREVLHELACLISVKAEDKGLQFNCWVDPEVPACLLGDPARLRQVLVNLAGNSIKFTEKGRVTITARVQDGCGHEGCDVVLKFTVIDTGVGVSPGKRNGLFDRFTQADTSVTRKFGGTGLGLAISKHLVKLMGGEIGLMSQEGNGSEFWFTAKFQKVQKKIEQKQKVVGECIVVASANAELRRDLARMLTRRRAFVVETQGKDMLSLLKSTLGSQKPVNAVILDDELDSGDAVTIARAIREDQAFGNVAIVSLRSLVTRLKVSMHRDVFDAVLFRPPSEDKLLECLSRLLSREQINPAPRPAMKKPSSLRASQRILLVEDNKINQMVVQAMLKRLDLKADVAANGKEALDLLERQQYDIVLMDIQMPEMDGHEATRRIRTLPDSPLARVPIIAMTAHAREEDKQQCLLAGMDDYMTKPITFQGLAQMLEKWQPKAEDLSPVSARSPS